MTNTVTVLAESTGFSAVNTIWVPVSYTHLTLPTT